MPEPYSPTPISVESSEVKYPAELWKTLVSIAFAIVGAFSTTTALSFIHDRVPERTPLPDVLFDVAPPFFDTALEAAEGILLVCMWGCLILVFFHKHRSIILRRAFFMIGNLYLMRSLTMIVTQVPVASVTYYCSPKANSTDVLLILKRSFTLLSGFGLSINGKHTLCGDYIYSGHTASMMLYYLFIKEYTPSSWYLLHWFVWVVCFCGVMLLINSRGHYTVDVILAYYVTTRLFWIYHTMAKNPDLKKRTRENSLARVWWFRLFLYFEGNVSGVVPNQYEWPLPWPRDISRYMRVSTVSVPRTTGSQMAMGQV